MATQTMTQTATVPKSISFTAAPSKTHHALLGSFAPPASKSKRVVTLAELQANDGIGSATGRAWMAIHGHVFDITEFSKTHPGGQSIRLGAGRDGTCLIESYHPLSAVSKVEASLYNKCEYIGVMEQAPTQPASGNKSSVATYKRPDERFFLDVRARVDAFITSKSDRYAYEFIGQAEAFLTLALYILAVYQVTVNGSWLWTIALGVLTGRMGFLMHMANHCAVSRSPRVNRFVGWFMDVIGSNATIWGYEHQVAHHGEPNEVHRDNDCEIGAPMVRMHPEIPHTETMKYQHVIIPLAMTIGFFKWYAGDFGHFMRKNVGSVRMAIDAADWKLLISFKAAWFVIHVIAPLYFNGLVVGLAQLFVFMGIGAHYLENIFIVNHIQDGLVPPPDAHWSTKQVLATSNWSSGSTFWNFVSGGLNHQVEHHMFPSLSSYWYPHISPIVEATCKEHGLPYHNYANFPQAWMAMITYLKDMGREDFVSVQGQKGAVAKKVE